MPVLVMALLPAMVTGIGVAQPVELANENFLVRLDAGQAYAVTGIVHRASGVNFIRSPGEPSVDRSPWLITIRDTRGEAFALSASDAGAASHEVTGDGVRITWSDVGSEACPADLTVTVTARLATGSVKSYWRIDVEGDAPGVIWQVDFPRIFDIRPPGEDRLCLPHYWGRLWRNPTARARRVVLSYPQPASMQFFAYWVTQDAREPELPSVEGRTSETGWSPDRSDAAGLYWAAEDGEVYYKRFAVDTQTSRGRLCWWVEHLPELDTWPIAEGARGVRYSLPYDIAIGTFTGDYHEAAALYRDWAKDQVWCSRGPASKWPEEMPAADSEELVRWVPPWFREIGFWAKFYHEPAKVLPEWAAYRKWLRAPMASHYYRYNVSTFDDNYPEHLPPDPYFIDGVRDARALGVRPLPYINGVIWDTDTQSWLRENGFAAALKNEIGEIYPWDIHGEIYASMNPATEQWRAKMRETAGKLIVEHGVNGVYLDCLTATRAHPSYDPNHPHPCHGGKWFGQGNRKLMHDLRAHIRRHDPEACFFTEEIGELVIDVMDGYLTLDQWRSLPPPGMQVFPVFTAVYHPYTINFGCDAFIGQAPDVFAWEMAQMLVWGAQPLNSTAIAPPPKPGDANSELLREVVQAYHVAGRRFLQGGEWRRIAVRPPDGKPAECGLELVAQPHAVQYDQRMTHRRLWHGPSVMASAWERDGDLAVVMANITAEEQSVELTVRAEALGLGADTKLVRTWPRPAEPLGAAAGTHRTAAPGRKVMVFVITTDVERASQGRELDETPWELVHVEESGALPAAAGPTGSLWACSDGPVLNRVDADGTSATAQRLSEQGTLEDRHGRQAKVRGQRDEGRGLPRDLAEKPFALLRRLPHRVQADAGEVVVFSGGEGHLSCLAPGGAELAFSKPGLVVATDAVTGEPVRRIEAPVADRLKLPPEKQCLVGYATLDGPVARALSNTVRALRDGPEAGRAKALARATAALYRLECSLDERPGALSPVSPLMRLHDELQTLASAHVGGFVELTARHRWLTPGEEKAVALLGWSRCGAFDDSTQAELIPVGNWSDGGCAADIAGAPRAAGDVRRFGGSIVLSDLRYVERMAPVVGAVRVQRAGRTFTISDVLQLEANRPFEIRKPTSVLTVVAGRTGESSVLLRNWSPEEVTARVSVDGPDGWRIEPETPTVDLPALTDRSVGIAFSPPAGAPRGSYEVRCYASHHPDASAEVVAIVRVALLPSLVPLTADARPEPPADDNLARLRRAGKLVVYAEEGEQLRLSVHNYRAGNYTATGRFAFRGPDLATLGEGAIPLNESRDIDLRAPETGTYYLEVYPGVGQAEVRSENALIAELATEREPLNLFCSAITRHFYVPADSTGFELCAQDGGPDETARFIVTAPRGRVALDRDGNYAGTRMAIEVQPPEAGKVWTLRVEPRQDVSLWLTGDVCPYLSARPEAVLIEERGR